MPKRRTTQPGLTKRRAALDAASIDRIIQQAGAQLGMAPQAISELLLKSTDFKRELLRHHGKLPPGPWARSNKR